ncbi:MAG: hypothetical protein Q4C87_02365 [Actinomycetaceae bacterium]|nr:hypothetical protein [Actinomycetaceae bacterium]
MSSPSPYELSPQSTAPAVNAYSQYSPAPTYGPHGNASTGAGFQGPAPRALNYWGLIALGLIAIRDIIGLSWVAVPRLEDPEMSEFAWLFADSSFLVLSALALPFGIFGLMRKNTRAWWTAVLATGMGTWSLIVRLISFMITAFVDPGAGL